MSTHIYLRPLQFVSANENVLANRLRLDVGEVPEDASGAADLPRRATESSTVLSEQRRIIEFRLASLAKREVMLTARGQWLTHGTLGGLLVIGEGTDARSICQ